MEFVEWSGKGADRPLAYASIERTFFKEFIYKRALETAIDEGMERGDSPRVLEREQLVRLMSLFADVFFVGHWDPEIGGRRLENRIQQGDSIQEGHLRAWRIAREEVLANVLRWVRIVLENYYAWTGHVVDRERFLHRRLPEDLWRRVELFLHHLAELPCWVDRALSITVFGAKQNAEFWRVVLDTGKAPTGVRVLAQPLDLQGMIREVPVAKGTRT